MEPFWDPKVDHVCIILLQKLSKIACGFQELVFTSFLDEELVDRLIIFRSNYFIGGTGVNAINLLNKKKKITFKPTQLSIVKNNTMEILEKQNY